MKESNLDGSLADGLAERHAGFTLADQLWALPSHEALDIYLDLLATRYDTGLRLVDFADEEGARRAINDWVREQTSGRIPELLPTATPRGTAGRRWRCPAKGKSCPS